MDEDIEEALEIMQEDQQVQEQTVQIQAKEDQNKASAVKQQQKIYEYIFGQRILTQSQASLSNKLPFSDELSTVLDSSKDT